MNYERWGQSLGVDIMPSAQPMLVQPPTSYVPSNTTQSTSTKTSTPTGPTGPQLVAMLPSIIGAVAQGVAQGTQQPGTVPSNMPVQPDTGVPEMQCQDGYYRDPSSGICAPVSIAPRAGQNVPGTAMPVAAAQPSIVLPVLTFVGGCFVGAIAMHLYMGPKKSVTSNRGRRPRRNRRRARR